MFIKKTKNSRGQAYYHIAESYWKDGKSRHRTLMSLGRAKDARLEDLLKLISRHLDVISANQLAKKIDVKETFILGPLLIIDAIFKQLNLYGLLSDLEKKHPKIQFDFVRIVFTLVMSRFIEPCSKLKVFSHWQKLFYPGFLNFKKDLSLQDIYRCLDMLSEHKEDIEMSLYHKCQSQKSLFNECDVVLYDLTTLRFESTREDLDHLRRFGYSKEKRSDCTQVVLGLLVDKEGMPLGFDVYPGNTYEGKTMPEVLSKLKEKFNIRRFIIVGDRGLFSNENLNLFKEKGHEFIVGLKLSLLKSRSEEIYNLKNFKWVNDDLAIYETEHKGYRCTISWSRKRADRDKKLREDILSKLSSKLSKKTINPKDFISNTNYKKYISHPISKAKPQLNEEAIKEAERQDGFFGMITNTKDISSQELILNYKHLWKIEKAFRDIKGFLKTRPMFHWTDKRILGHLVLCFISYLCEAYLSKKLYDKGIKLRDEVMTGSNKHSRSLSVLEAMLKLKEVRAIPITLKDKKLWIRTDITGNVADVFKAIGAKIPGKQLKVELSPSQIQS